jgi:hypothetical protein
MQALQRRGVGPSAMAVVATAFSTLAGISLYNAPLSGRPELFWALGAVGIQARLLCELLSGMLMVRGLARSKLDSFLTEMLARASDALVLVGAGYSVDLFLPGGSSLGWLAAVLAVLTAFVRVLGGALGLPPNYAGPLARQQRMYLVTFGAIAAGVQNAIFRPGWAMVPALLLVVIGTGWTLARRAEALVRQLSR